MFDLFCHGCGGLMSSSNLRESLDPYCPPDFQKSTCLFSPVDWALQFWIGNLIHISVEQAVESGRVTLRSKDNFEWQTLNPKGWDIMCSTCYGTYRKQNCLFSWTWNFVKLLLIQQLVSFHSAEWNLTLMMRTILIGCVFLYLCPFWFVSEDEIIIDGMW